MDIQDPAARTDRVCGACSLCCKLLHVVELDKPAGKWCGYCKPGKGGCSIHETRPDICRSYFCGWILSEKLGDEWFPLRCHMILSLAKIGGIQTMTVTVDGKYPFAWLEPPYYAQIKASAVRGLRVDRAEDIHIVQVRVGNRVWLVLPNKDVEITRGSYIVKLAASNRWEVEQFATQEEAAERIAILAPHQGIQISVPSEAVS